jgi:hypothetical protein
VATLAAGAAVAGAAVAGLPPASKTPLSTSPAIAAETSLRIVDFLSGSDRLDMPRTGSANWIRERRLVTEQAPPR